MWFENELTPPAPPLYLFVVKSEKTDGDPSELPLGRVE